VEPGKGVLKISEMEVYAEPRVEWKQMFNEALRLERDFFYDPGLHGLNLAPRKRVMPLPRRDREPRDLNYLFEICLESSPAATFRERGRSARVKPVPTGLLGPITRSRTAATDSPGL